MFGRGNGGYWSGALKGQEHLPRTGVDPGGDALLALIEAGKTNPALAAIDDMTGSGNSAFPRPTPMAFRPRAPMDALPDTYLAGSGTIQLDPITPKPSITPPPIPGAITFKRGDTVSELAKRLGMTTASFADRYGISNPNKIRAGDTVVPLPPVMPRMPPPGMVRSGPSVLAVPLPRPRPRESFDQVWAEAKGY